MALNSRYFFLLTRLSLLLFLDTDGLLTAESCSVSPLLNADWANNERDIPLDCLWGGDSGAGGTGDIERDILFLFTDLL